MTKRALKPFWTYSPDAAVEKAVAAIYDAYPPALRGTLQHVTDVLDKLGNPHKNLPPVFHAAGTNGKGSTLAFVQALLEAGGRTVHKFTSPHLIRFEERFIISGKMIEPQVLLSLMAEVDAATTGQPVSFFEFFTILFFVAAARYPADATLLETGLGGVLDSTNVIEQNACAILTRISRDHTHLLGETLPEIAAQKAGIIKPNCPVAMAPQSDIAVMDVFLKQAKKMNAPRASWLFDCTADGFSYHGAVHLSLPLPALAGAHQVINAATAIAAVEQTMFRDVLTEKNAAAAMRNVCWDGRWQQLHQGRLHDLLPQGWELWLDGAHNDSGAEVLSAELQRRGRPGFHMITAFKGKKDPAEFYAPLKSHLASVTIAADGLLSDMPSVPMVAPVELQKNLADMGYNVAVADDLESAIQSLAFQFQAPQRILISGSLYLVGHALKVNS